MRIAEFSVLSARLLLAAVFLLAGATKLIDPVGSRKAFRDFGLPLALARPLVVLLPVLELAVTVALIPTGLAWYGAWGALALLIVFLLAAGIAMARGRRPDCHCFGQLHSAPVGWPLLIRNGVLAGLAGWLVLRRPAQSGPDLWTWLATLDSHESKAAFVIACVMAFLFIRALYGARPRSHPVEQDLEPLIDEEEAIEERPAPVPVRRPAPVPVKPAASVEPPAPAGIGPLNLGLPIGTPAPQFELPTLTGEKRSLQSLLAEGKDVLLVFSSPFCETCKAVASNLARWMREMEGLPSVIVITFGDAKDNLAKLKEFDPSRVLLQREFEVGKMYDTDTTPTAVLVGNGGLIQSELALGGTAIKQLLSSYARRANRAVQDATHAERG